MPDYNVDQFALVHDKLKQSDIRRSDGSLIPAWDNLRELRVGTIVGVVATLHAFNIVTSPNVYKRVRLSCFPIINICSSQFLLDLSLARAVYICFVRRRGET